MHLLTQCASKGYYRPVSRRNPVGTRPQTRRTEREDTVNENLRAFLEAAKDDPELCERLTKMAAGELVAAAKEKGIDLTEEDLTPPAGELDDAELNSIAGGKKSGCFISGYDTNGHDSVDGKAYTCFCLAYGQGGDERWGDANCFCVIGGQGQDNWQVF